GCRRLEICPLPALLSPGARYLERAVLPAAVNHEVHAASGSDSLSLRSLPLQFCQLPAVQGTLFVAQEEGRGGSGCPSRSGISYPKDGARIVRSAVGLRFE